LGIGAETVEAETGLLKRKKLGLDHHSNPRRDLNNK
jgi:hypothetical protein